MHLYLGGQRLRQSFFLPKDEAAPATIEDTVIKRLVKAIERLQSNFFGSCMDPKMVFGNPLLAFQRRF